MNELPKLITEIPGPNSKKLASKLKQFESPNITYISQDFPIFWSSANGCIVKDVDGNTLLDITSAFGVSGVGHTNPAVINCIHEQSKQMIHGMGDVHPSEVKVKFLEELVKITPPKMNKVILSSTGAEAVESAIKSAIVYTGRDHFIAFNNAYHGLTLGALSATGMNHFKKPFNGIMKDFITHIPYAYCYRCAYNKKYPECKFRCVESIRKLFKTKKRKGNIAGIIVEPIQGRAGVIVPPIGWLSLLKSVCEKNGSLLIADEIFTGFGRTGTFFNSEVIPDILILGKTLGGGFPISVCISSEKIMNAWGDSSGEAIHTSTFLGNPLGCAIAIEVMQEILKQDMILKSRKLGGYIEDELLSLKEEFPLIIGDVRGMGLMWGVEFADPDKVPLSNISKYIINSFLKNGIIALSSGEHSNVLSITPPYVISKEQLEYFFDIFKKILLSIKIN